MGGNALITYDATDATTGGQVQLQETGSQSLLITHQLELEIERNQLGTLELSKQSAEMRQNGKQRRRRATAQKKDQQV